MNPFRPRLVSRIALGLLAIGIMFIIVCLFSGCTVKPFIVSTAPTATAPAKTYNSLGGSIFTKAKAETASMTLPDGTQMSYSVTNKSEVAVPNAVIAGSVAEAISSDLLSSDTAATAAEVTKSQISATEAIEITKSNNALEAAKIIVPE